VIRPVPKRCAIAYLHWTLIKNEFALSRKSFNDQRNAGGEPNAADISDQEYRVVAGVRGSRREDIVDREIAVSRQRDGVSDWCAMDSKRPVRQWPTDYGREDALPTIRPNRVAAGKK
jgi:hypothetical protein